MNANEQNRIKKILQEALPPVEDNPDLDRDLWPEMLRRLDAQPAALPEFHAPLLDWALLTGLVAFIAFFPASIPVFLYYL